MINSLPIRFSYMERSNMSRTITGHFDGKVIILEKRVRLPVGKRLRIQVTVDEPRNGKKPRKQIEIIGTGQFDSGIPDLGSNKKHLKGLGRK
jgi:hypothetical protein